MHSSDVATFLQICFNYKQQLTILCLLQSQASTSEASREWQKLQLAQNIIDIRIAQFLLTPNSPNVTDSPELHTALQEVNVPPIGQTSVIAASLINVLFYLAFFERGMCKFTIWHIMLLHS